MFEQNNVSENNICTQFVY